MLITDLKVLAILIIMLSIGLLLHIMGEGMKSTFKPVDVWLSSGNHKQQERARCFVAAVVIVIITIVSIIIMVVSK